MSFETRPKKLRGSGGYVIAKLTDEQQTKGNLGGPDLFLAPIGRLDPSLITKYSCNTCEKEFDGSPKIDYENPNEEVAENLTLIERGQYKCQTCDSIIAEYREFKKGDEQNEVGDAKPLEQDIPQMQTEIKDDIILDSKPVDSTFSAITGKDVFDNNANKIGKAKQVGVDSQNSVVLVITTIDGDDITIKWEQIKKIGEIVLIGNSNTDNQQVTSGANCPNCNFSNSSDSKFCESCGAKL
jgi:sporulation protein YlmC with PRC-barrel domain